MPVNSKLTQTLYSELENEGLINTQRGIGKFLTEDETIIDNLRKEYSKELLRDFIHKSKTLGFSKEEILELIMNMYEEE